ncbi:FAD-binding oxidoreductase (plasmid) [Natronorubrum bangense]|uniref:FAD-binding oxidoreductase n=1 Tax=Natronorubrum bangense TaxID=61858 RepID=A0A4D6HQW1_9EURY|nr:FAD-binding protein [Natronorubrum bangense]QCC56414.1 FAD-binding oxidoreductase [Natronorubrum bangense]
MGVTTSDLRVPTPLEGVLEGEADFGEPTRTLYATDASIYEVKPAGVVFPAGREDVRRVVEYAREHGVSITPRGREAV